MHKTPIIIGTAGHVDHGKTALVKQLTGTDTDRLKEEKQRELTIDLGFAFLNARIAFIDVPGHEKFIKNMVAGASTIDFALLVIAADDSVMPQTKEHLNIMEAMGIEKGAIVISKIDMVSREWINMVHEELEDLTRSTFLEGSKVFEISSTEGTGVQDLRNFLINLDYGQNQSYKKELFRMPVDRVFSLHGYGTIVTGTVISGNIETGNKLHLYPSGRRCEIRNIQKHGRDSSFAIASERAALNLSGINKEQIKRGEFLADRDSFKTGRMITTRVNLFQESPPMEYNTKIRINIGTGEHIGRIRLIGRNNLPGGESTIAQIEFEEKSSAGFRDKFVIRRLTPPKTIGGGEALLIDQDKIRKKDTEKANKLKTLYQADTKEAALWFIKRSKEGIDIKGLTLNLSMSPAQLTGLLKEMENDNKIIKINDRYIATVRFNSYKDRIIQLVENYHQNNPLYSGIDYNGLVNQIDINSELVDYILFELEKNNKIEKIEPNKYALSDFEVTLSQADKKLADQIYAVIKKAGIKPIPIESLNERFENSNKKILSLIHYLIRKDKIIDLEDSFVISDSAFEKSKKIIKNYLKENKKARVADIRDLLGTTRKYILPILKYLDNIDFTYREGEYRYLKE